MDTERQTEITNQIKVYKDKFLSYNRAKLATLYASISSPQVIGLLEAIPYLLGTNQQGIPGFINFGDLPSGAQNYTISTKAEVFLKTEFPGARMVLDKDRKPFIQMFALMGSGGTIAYTKQSDFDFWICADEREITPEAARLFKLKCRIIENWITERFHVEVHFFLNDITKVRKNIFDEDSEESLEGTSLGELLKEEFFRSSIVLNGKIPFWWVVPAGSDDKVYAEWLAAAGNSYLAEDFVDLGNLYAIVREDFLVAALFQLLKSLGNPFKSIIKLGLLERYIHSGDGSPFISNTIKKNVHAGRLNMEDIDSYVIMFDHVYDFYTSSMRDEAATDILETCFYLKVDPKLSAFMNGQKGDAQPPKVRKMLDYIKTWNWSESAITEMDNFENLDIDSVNRLLSDTKKYILRGYKDILSNIETRNISHKLAAEELKGITRKIYSHFSLAENKIDNTLSFKNYPPEKLLHIEFVRDKDGKEFWILSKRVIVRNLPAKVIIHKETSLVAITVWISLNGLFQKDFTRLEIDPGIHPLDPNFIRELITDLSQHFSVKRVDLHNSYFLRDALPVVGYVIINPYTKYSKKIDDIIFLYHNSWGETRFDRYKTEVDMAQILARVLNGALKAKLDFDTALRIISSQPYSSSRELDRIILTLRDAYSFFVDRQTGEKKRYLTVLGNTYFVFSTKKTGGEEVITATPCETEIKMLYSISYNTGSANAIRTDPSIPELNYIRTIIENHKEDTVQIYFQKEAKYCYFFVSDERGSIIFYRKSAESYVGYLARLCLFAGNVIKRVTARNQRSPLAEKLKQIEVYRLERDIHHKCRITEINPELDGSLMAARKALVPFVLSLHAAENGELGYRFTLPDGTFTNIFTNANILQIIGDLRLLMRATAGYSYYITDIDLTHIAQPQYRNYTSFAFTEKNLFEMLIEKGLQSAAK